MEIKIRNVYIPKKYIEAGERLMKKIYDERYSQKSFWIKTKEFLKHLNLK